MPKLEKLSCKYGAPFGRPDLPHVYGEFGAIPDATYKFHLQKVKLDSGGYDSGGAYWGLRNRGETLYWAVNENETVQRFFDAKSRDDAKRFLRQEFPNCRFFR